MSGSVFDDIDARLAAARVVAGIRRETAGRIAARARRRRHGSLPRTLALAVVGVVAWFLTAIAVRRSR